MYPDQGAEWRRKFLDWHDKRSADHAATGIALTAATDEEKAARREVSRWQRRVGLPVLGVFVGTCLAYLIAHVTGVPATLERVLTGLVLAATAVFTVMCCDGLRRQRRVEQASARIRRVLNHADSVYRQRLRERREWDDT